MSGRLGSRETALKTRTMKTRITAIVVADSINTFNNRITSMLLTMPRIILAEFNTHRMLSRNSASSRAIPFRKMVQAVRQDCFIPLAWQKDHPGMQGSELLDEGSVYHAKLTWLVGRDYAVQQATILNETHGVTKQLANRMLETYMWHTVLVTGTEWENFFALRYHPDAEVHMQILAEEMLTAMNGSTPKQLQPGEWHMPLGDDISISYGEGNEDKYCNTLDWHAMQKVKIATARAARTSYTLPESESKHDYAKDAEMHDKLLKAGHMSPFEHCARAMTHEEHSRVYTRTGILTNYNAAELEAEQGWCRNFRGWVQYRALIPNENREDTRLIKHVV